MEIFSLRLKNLKGKPNEDFYLVNKKYPIFAVADGVSRTRNRNGGYPEISGAKLAAEEFCKKVIEHLEGNFLKANLKTLERSFNFANKAIFNLNEKYGINKKLNYLENDYFGTCGATAFVKNNIFYYGYIGDCGIRIYDKNDFFKLISVNEVEPLEKWRDNKKFKSEKEYWLCWRKILRNRPKAPYLTYGVFTGEPEVENYYHFGKIKIEKGDLILLYSDGFLYFIEKAEFRKLFREFENEILEKQINPGRKGVNSNLIKHPSVNLFSQPTLSNRVNQFIKREIKKNSGKETFRHIDDDKTLISILI